MTKRGFLDGGARFLEGLRHCVGELGIDASWEVISYEPAPASFAEATAQAPSIGFAVDLRQAALWSEDRELELWTEVGWPTSDGNTVMMAPGRSVDGKNMRASCSVPAHDINRVLDELVARGCDEIHIKLDIEGAEFEVVPRLLTWEHLKLVRTARIEWHERFFREELPEYQARRAELTRLLREQGINTIDHW